MIINPTVLILGAGASMPYGYPSGKELRDRIFNLLKYNSGTNFFGKIFDELGFKKSELEKFRDGLFYSPLPSIDAFLESREEFVKIGKAAIAIELIKCEKEDLLFGVDPIRGGEDWYSYFFQCIHIFS